MVRRSASPLTGSATSHVSAAVHTIVGLPGRELPPAVRRFMEGRFGHDFGDVRVHTDTMAAYTAQALGARAYTVGRNVVFAGGQFMPDSAAGQQLIAHELAHVIQQRAGAARLAAQPLTVSDPADPAEREADRAAAVALAPAPPGRAGPVSTTAGKQGPPIPQLPTCTTATGSGPPSGLTVSGFGPGSTVMPGSGYLPLLRLASRLKGGDASSQVEVHGFASEEGDPGFNLRLSCARAAGVRDVIQANGVSNPISLVAHGASEALGGRREQNRAVIVREPAAPAAQQSGEGRRKRPPVSRPHSGPSSAPWTTIALATTTS